MHKTVRTPLQIQVLFLLIIALGAVGFLFAYKNVEASPLDSFCQRQFNISFFRPITPIANKKCKAHFERITSEWRTGLYTNK